MNKINIVLISDLNELVELFEEHRKFYKKRPNKQKARVFLQERMAQKDSTIIVSKNIQNKLNGFLQLYPLFSSTQMEKMWLLNDLYVKPEHRQHVISVALINKAKQYCKKTKACGLLETLKQISLATRFILKQNLY
ncbi:MAG: GNAT family N-acetyltransferase [Bacteroidia bacterium]